MSLRAPSAASLQGAALKLEDAFRTASLPDAGGRVLVVRRLHLGTIDPAGSPSGLALRLEQAVALAGLHWVHGMDPAAEGAQAVWFRDALEAHVGLALRWLSAPPPREWFWPLAVRVSGSEAAFESDRTAGVSPVAAVSGPRTPAAALRGLARGVAALPEAPVALPQWIAALVGAGHRAALIDALTGADLAPLLRAAGGDKTGVMDVRAALDDRRGSMTGAAAAFVSQMLRQAGVVDRVENGRVSFSPRPRTDSSSEAPGGVRSGATGNGDGSDHGCRETRAAGGDSATLTPSAAGLPATPDRGTSRSRRSMPSRRERNDPASKVAAESPGPGVGEATEAGGILFLLNALQRLGYPEWLQAQSAWVRFDLARRVLGRQLQRLGVAPDDPAHGLVAPQRHAPRHVPLRFVAPMRWHDGLLRGRGALQVSRGEHGSRLLDASGELMLGAWRGSRPRALHAGCRTAVYVQRQTRPLDVDMVGCWEIALRRWLRRYARIGLVDVVLRPARVLHTSTHVDIHFNPDVVDLRVRRAGLDLDPGWVPWFGRVVGFHYSVDHW